MANELRSSGILVEVHDDHLPAAAPDEEWIALVGKKGWIAITKDKNIRYRTGELQAIKAHRTRVVVLRTKGATGLEMAESLRKAKGRIFRYANEFAAPFVLGVDRRGRILPYRGLFSS